MNLTTAPTAYRFGIVTALALALLTLAYAIVLAIGLLTLPSPSHAIQDPWFTLMEVLILAIAPTMVAFTVALHQWVPQERQALSLSAVVFMAMCAIVTCTVHFAVLTLSRLPTFAEPSIARAVFAFQWPSVVYALDILAWDFFFPIAAMLAGASLGGSQATLVRWLILASGLLAFVGLAGVPLANMQIRNIGIIGYVLVFPLGAVLMAKRFSRPGRTSSA